MPYLYVCTFLKRSSRKRHLSLCLNQHHWLVGLKRPRQDFLFQLPLVAPHDDQRRDDDEGSQHDGNRADRSCQPVDTLAQEIASQPIHCGLHNASQGVEKQKGAQRMRFVLPGRLLRRAARRRSLRRASTSCFSSPLDSATGNISFLMIRSEEHTSELQS